MHGGRHRPEVALLGEHLAEGSGHVYHPDVGGVDHGLGECLVDDLPGQAGEVDALPVQIAREVALIAPENPHVTGHRPRLLQLTERQQ